MRMSVRSFDDLVVLAAVACHWNSNPDANQTYPQFMVDSDPGKSFDKRSLACLVQGVLNLARVRLDNEGRLLQLS